MRFTRKIKIAFVHDDFIQSGGAEKFFFDLILNFSSNTEFEIKIYSSLISKSWKEVFDSNQIIYQESFLAKIPFCYLIHKLFFLLDWFYFAFLSFDFDSYDFVISSSTRFGHGILTKPTTYHISYINSPARALWDEKGYFFGKKLFYFFIKSFLPQKRIYDYYSQNYADIIIANSKNIQAKIKKYYNRNSLVLYPFVNLPPKRNSLKKDYFIIISRLVSWKRIDYVIDTFNLNGLSLLILGTGPDLPYYKKISNKNISFLGYVSENLKNDLLSGARGLIFPQKEDFGLILLEAVNFDCPILYYNKGGALEILNNKLGILFENQSTQSLQTAIDTLKDFRIDKSYSQNYLENFSQKHFLNSLKKIIYSNFKKRRI